MRWSRTVQTVDVHCAGEIGRVITGGVGVFPAREAHAGNRSRRQHLRELAPAQAH